MPTRILTFQFSRLNLIAVWTTKQEYLFKSLSAQATIPRRQFKYSFFDVQELTWWQESFATGHLVKYKPILEEEVVDEATHQLATDEVPEGVVAKSLFFLHYRTGILAFRPITSRLGPKQFRDVFARLVEAANSDFFVNAEVQPIDEGFEMSEALRRFQIISRITINLHPSNPSNREIWQHVDERIKLLHAQRLIEIVFGSSTGLSINALEQDDVYRGMLMAADGYGRAEVSGVIDGRTTTVSTEDSPTEAQVRLHDDLNETLAELIPTFQRIWDRMTQ